MANPFMKLKNHIVDYKEIYITCAITAVVTAGITTLAVFKVKSNSVLSQKAVALWNSTINQTAVQITIDAPGNSGNIIKDLTTGTIYPSQNAASKALGVNPTNLSMHLRGKNSDVAGHVFEKLIDGGAAHALAKV